MPKRKCYSLCGPINDTARKLVKANWEMISEKRHVRLRSPNGKLTITVPFSPSDTRAEKNWHSQIRNLGVIVPN